MTTRTDSHTPIAVPCEELQVLLDYIDGADASEPTAAEVGEAMANIRGRFPANWPAPMDATPESDIGEPPTDRVAGTDSDTIVSIERDLRAGTVDDGAPVLRAENVKVGDVLIVDWPAWILAKVQYVHHEVVEGSRVTICRWQIRSCDENRQESETAFISRGSHEYVRVVRMTDRPDGSDG